MTREEILSAIAKTDKVINNPTMPEAVKQVAIDTRAKYQAQLDAMGGEEPKVEKEEVVETEVEKEVEKEVVAPKKERVKFERKPRTPKAPTPKKEEETPESKAEKSMEGKKLTVANCRELLAKLKTRREGAKKRVATRKKQGKPAELTTIEVLKKASDNLEKKVETEVNKDGKLQKTTITRSTKEVVDIVATIISGIPTKAERTKYINEVIADLKKLIDKVEPITEKMGMGGGIYSSEELYIVKVYDAKTGELLDMSKRVWAKNLTKAKENAIDDYEYDMQAKYGDYLRFSVEKAPSMFAKGGKIENQYAGRNAKDIWESWNEEQKVHFFTDHKQHPYYNNGDEKFVVSKNDREKYVGMNYEELPRMVKLMISDHVEDGQYAKGGEIGQELMGGQPNQKKPSGAILLAVRKNGKEIVVTEDDGKTKELYVKSNGFSGYTLHYKGNEYEFANSLDSYAKGGAINPNIILSFSFNTDNISLNEVKRIVEGYSKDWRTSGDISQVNFYVTLKENDADDLLKELKSYGYFYDFEKTKNRYAKGGMMSNGGILNEETKYKIDNGFTKKSFNEILNELFPYNFGFKVFKPLNRQNILTPNYDEAPSVLYGYDDSQIKSKLHFDQYKRDHAINFAIEQGGENTYYYFLIADQEGNEYVGTFGFKDQGDVDSSYVTRFIAFLMECYGLPFEVKHSVMAKGGYMAKGGISKDFSGNYYSTNDFVQQNGLEEEAVKVFGEDWEAEDDVDQIAELANHMGLKYVIKYAETRNQWNKLRQIDTYHKTPDSEYDIFVISNENWKKYLNK
jgi:5-hydroxyisourate hydrolase-like protein (transthyretin family)